MVTYEQQDTERVGKAILHHLQRGETDLSMTLLKTLRLVEESGGVPQDVASQIPKQYEKVAQETRDVLSTQRKELEDRQFKGALSLYEQSLVLSIQAMQQQGQQSQEQQQGSQQSAQQQAQPSNGAGAQDVYFNPGEVAQQMAANGQDNQSADGQGNVRVVRPFGGDVALPVS